ncbi:esterase family protein [Opitutaceae bacterium TAV4]|nr:esterase family protein [Opitutaceae bacterium TAV4]RRJ98594.1 esterase family protein [Opitutaceae bacterium TAV3]
MAWSTIHWKSDVLGKQTTAQVLLPDVGKPPYATFYLLHGLSDDSTNWLRRSRIEVYAAGLPLIVVMPDGYRGFYTDNDQGPAYAKHFGEELPSFVERTFHAKAARGARAIGGLSMGGYGALRIGLGYADRFCSVNSHSGAVGWGQIAGAADYKRAAKTRGWNDAFTAEMRRVFGSGPRGGAHDLLALARQAQAAGRLPKLMLDCGTEDFLIEDNRAFTRALAKQGVPHSYAEHPGAHTWDYWDEHIREALAFHAKNLRLKLTS